MAGIAFTFVFIFLFLGHPILSRLSAVFVLVFCTPILMNVYEKHTIAKMMSLLWGNLSIIVFSGIVGKSAGFHLVFIGMVALPLVFFNVNQKKYILIGVFTPLLSWAFLEITHYPMFISIEFPSYIPQILYYLLFMTSYVFTLLVMLFFYFSNEAAQHQVINQSKQRMEFVSKVTHELRSPMHIILGFLKLGIKKIKDWDSEQQLKNMGKINRTGEELLEYLDALLDIAKLESKAENLIFKNHDILDIIQDVQEKFEVLLKEKNLTMELEQKTTNTTIPCDKIKIRQVINNLVSNAIKFTPEGKSIRVKISERYMDKDNPSRALCISIIDSGIGIPETELETIFEKYLQSSRAGKETGGTGLGLPICKEILQRHQGKVWAENNVNGGAIFSVLLPKIQGI